MVADCPVMWSSDNKSNVTYELPSPKNQISSNTWFYFDELKPTLVSRTVIFFKMAAISDHVTTQK